MPGFFFTTTNDNHGQQKNKKVAAVVFVIAYPKNGVRKDITICQSRQ